MKSKAVKAKEDHQVEVTHLLKEKAKVDHLLKKRSAEVEELHQAVRDAEQASMRVEEELVFEVEKRRKMEVEMAKKE